MKHLFFSDLHLHNWSYGARINEIGSNSRLEAQKDALDEILNYVQENNIKQAYFLGDLFHTHGRIPTQALNVAVDFFRKLRYFLGEDSCRLKAIYGNHDMADRSGIINAVKPILTIDEFIQNSTHTYVENHGYMISALPYTANEEEIKRFLGNIGEERSIVLLHQGVSGVPLGSGFLLDESLTPDMIPDNCIAFTGHYHMHKVVSPNLCVVGNLTPLTWSDMDQVKGFVVWDDETNEIIQVPQKTAPRFISLTEEQCATVNPLNCFVRYVSKIKKNDQEDLRKQLIDAGALTVEFPVLDIKEEENFIRSGADITLEHILQAINTEDMEPRRKEIGIEIREERYEAPKA